MAMLLLLSTGAIQQSFGFVPTDVVSRVSSSQCHALPTALCAGKSEDSDNAELLERARRLREEASVLEDNLRASSPASASASAEMPVAAIVNIQLEESKWTLTYRFSSQPSPKEPKDDEPPKTFYSGKLNLLLKEDGYSEQIIESKSKTDDIIEIIKIWGWDRETSNEDNLDYLLFSMDVKFPNTDPDLSNQTERCYFQARIEQSSDGSISLKEGTITVKKDVTEKTGGMWGLFNVAGILTEFRYTGDFVAKAS